MIPRPPGLPRSDPLFPYPTLFRSLLLGILQILTALDLLPPTFVFTIPVDGALNGLFKAVLGLPAQLALDLRGVDSVTAVMAGAILYIADRLLPAQIGRAHV